MKNRLKETEWLLAFANLGKTPGKLSPPFQNLEKLKRKPKVADRAILSGHLVLYENKLTSGRGGMITGLHKAGLTPEGEHKNFSFKEFDDLISQYGIPTSSHFTYTDQDGTPVLKYCPETIHVKLERVKKPVAIKTSAGIGKKSGLKYDAYCLLGWYWSLVNCELESLTSDNYNLDDFISEILNNSDPSTRPILELQKNNIIFEHDNMFPQAITALLMNFLVNQTELHHRLKQCPACGKFFISGRKRGRPKIFCDPKCEDIFNQLPKEVQRLRVEGYRKVEKGKRQKDEFKKLSELIATSLDDSKYRGEIESPGKKAKREEKARKQAEDWIHKKGKTLKEYKKQHGL